MLALRRPNLMRAASRTVNPTLRRMCTAAAEEAPPGPFSLSNPTMQGVLGTFAATYFAILRWQSKDKSLAKEIAAHKAAHAPAHAPSPVVAAVAAEPAPAAPAAAAP